MSILRKFLLPFSLPYGVIVKFRNLLYDKDILDSVSFPIPIIVVGNLSVGGTGKTPMIEYLLEMLLPQYKIATLSRGYGRKTKGYIELQGDELAQTVGDEPLQFKIKFPKAIVAVDENRRRGISRIISKYAPEVILLDDAFQHRKVKGGLNILLTSFDKIYANDFLLPAGNLREPASGAGRANVIIVTKCPESLHVKEQERLRNRLKIKSYQQLFFSFIKYSDTLFDENGRRVDPLFLKDKKFTLVTGIAKPKPLLHYLEKKGLKFNHLKFSDHYAFSEKDIRTILNAEVVVTTEKDFMRLKSSVSHLQFYYIPIKTGFLNNEEKFQTAIYDYLK